MFQSPLGGIALVINILIVSIGSLINKIHGHSIHKPIVSQKQISKMHDTKRGKMLAHSLSYLIPILVFAAVGGMSIKAYTYFYYDTRKVTVLDAASYAITKTEDGYLAINKIIDEEIDRANSQPDTSKTSDPVGMYLGIQGYRTIQRQALILQDKITETTIEQIPALSNLLLKN